MPHFGLDPTKRELKRHERAVAAINALEEEFKALSNEQLRAKTDEFREYLEVEGQDQSHGQASKAGIDDSEEEIEAREVERAADRLLEERLTEILPEAFATVREMSTRILGMRHYDVQLIGGMVLHQGKIAEMRTGEGKTLVATLALYLNALTGRGAHLVTVNDYLVRRDAGWNAPLFDALGLSVAVIAADSSFIYDPEFVDDSHGDDRLRHLKPCTRREAYAADITYATNNELGFDYLRDNMALQLERCVQRRLHFAIVDEVDSILVDEARTPLIISGQASEPTDRYYEYAKLVPKLVIEDDYTVDEESRSVTLTEEGANKIEQWMGIDNIFDIEHVAEAHQVNRALQALALYRNEQEYIVVDGQVVIVDEFTGRTMPGRRWSDGLHQAVEAKEGVRVQQENITLATITFQNFFRLYDKLCGMTGTALTEAEEFDKIYKLEVVPIPTNKPMIRKDQSDLIYKSEEAKYRAVVEEIAERHENGQPVLVGTTSIEKSERLARMLEKRGIEHSVLNAKLHEREADIVAQAGQHGTVTIATNMAGRGTDITLGEGVAETGGLYIIGTERHESRRIDNQLRGRAGRQGDPGETRFFLSFDDDVMRIFGGDRMQSIMERFNFSDDDYIENRMVTRQIESAQSRVEGHNFDARRSIVDYDDVMNKQREIIYGERRKVLEGTDTRTNFLAMLRNSIGREVSAFLGGHGRSGWDLEGLWERLRLVAPPLPPLDEVDLHELKNSEEVSETVIDDLTTTYETYEERYEVELVRRVEQALMLQVIDQKWTEYLTHMTHLRDEVRMHGVGQLDPLIEYKNAAYEAFQALIGDIEVTIVHHLLADLPTAIEQLNEQARLLNEAELRANAKPEDAAQGAAQAMAPPSPRADRPGQARAAGPLVPPAARPAEAAASDGLARASSRSRQQTTVSSVLSPGVQVSAIVESGGSEEAAAPARATAGAGGAQAAAGGQPKLGRNEPCWCGSGKKFKRCHGQ